MVQTGLIDKNTLRGTPYCDKSSTLLMNYATQHMFKCVDNLHLIVPNEDWKHVRDTNSILKG